MKGKEKEEPVNVYYSRPIMWVYIAFVLGLIGYGLYGYLVAGRIDVLWQCLIPAILICVFLLRKYIDQRPLLIISSQGLKFRGKDWISWSSVKSVELETKGMGKTRRRKLVVEHDSVNHSGERIIELPVNNLNLQGAEIRREIRRFFED